MPLILGSLSDCLVGGPIRAVYLIFYLLRRGEGWAICTLWGVFVYSFIPNFVVDSGQKVVFGVKAVYRPSRRKRPRITGNKWNYECDAR